MYFGYHMRGYDYQYWPYATFAPFDTQKIALEPDVQLPPRKNNNGDV